MTKHNFRLPLYPPLGLVGALAVFTVRHTTVRGVTDDHQKKRRDFMVGGVAYHELTA